ncbi:MAG TPA: DUF4249 family protein [Longimicrobium sp.]|nr:DUF4249 family protein [Longimicrobium sp.]
MALLNPSRAAAALALALVAGCGDLVRPSDFVEGDPDQLLVHAVLQAGSDSAAVLLSRADAGRLIHGAQVRLLGSAGQAMLREVEGLEPCTLYYVVVDGQREPQGVCYAGAVPGGVRAGAAYRLEVELPTGERASGHTVVPSPPAVQGVADGVRVAAREETGVLVALEPLPLKWTAPPRVGVRAWSSRSWPAIPDARCSALLYRLESDSLVVIYGTDMEVDSARVVPVAGQCYVGEQERTRVDPDSAEVAIGITAYDSAYIAYTAEWDKGIPETTARAGLQGAYGVFGSAATTVRRVRLVPQGP